MAKQSPKKAQAVESTATTEADSLASRIQDAIKKAVLEETADCFFDFESELMAAGFLARLAQACKMPQAQEMPEYTLWRIKVALDELVARHGVALDGFTPSDDQWNEILKIDSKLGLVWH